MLVLSPCLLSVALVPSAFRMVLPTSIRLLWRCVSMVILSPSKLTLINSHGKCLNPPLTGNFPPSSGPLQGSHQQTSLFSISTQVYGSMALHWAFQVTEPENRLGSPCGFPVEIFFCSNPVNALESVLSQATKPG